MVLTQKQPRDCNEHNRAAIDNIAISVNLLCYRVCSVTTRALYPKTQSVSGHLPLAAAVKDQCMATMRSFTVTFGIKEPSGNTVKIMSLSSPVFLTPFHSGVPFVADIAYVGVFPSLSCKEPMSL